MNALDFSPLFRSTIGFDRLSQMQGIKHKEQNKNKTAVEIF